MKLSMKFIACLMMLALAVGIMPLRAFAEDAPGVAGCSAISVNPSDSLEFQQNVCNAAENTPATSCAASDHGTCSSPKLNDVLPDGDHCLCLGESSGVASNDEEPAEEPAPAS